MSGFIPERGKEKKEWDIILKDIFKEVSRDGIIRDREFELIEIIN